MMEQPTALPLQQNLEHEQLKRLETASLFEATTLALLVCIAVPAKHVFHWPLGTQFLGPVHGLAFLLYLWTALQTISGGGWSTGDRLRLFLVAFIPFAGFFNIFWIRNKANSLSN